MLNRTPPATPWRGYPEARTISRNGLRNLASEFLPKLRENIGSMTKGAQSSTAIPHDGSFGANATWRPGPYVALLAILQATNFLLLPGQSFACSNQSGQASQQTTSPGKDQETNQSPTAQTEAASPQTLRVTVIDETNVAVPFAHLKLEQQDRNFIIKGETDYSGRYEFTNLPSGPSRLRAEKEGFYEVTLQDVQVGETENVEVMLNHVREFTEMVNVVYSPPAIDPAKATASETLSSKEIIDLPYPVTRDIRYALPLLPGVLQDAFGQVHVDGSSTRQIYDQLDGFNISDPNDGLFNARVSVDALRSVDVQSSRYPVEYGKSTGGVLSLRTGMGDDHYRFSATDFIPSLQSHKGISIHTWEPRGSLSGPLRKGKAWFYDALEGEYNLYVVDELPAGADRNPAWRFSNLAKAQYNLTSSNILTGTFLVDGYNSEHAGISRFSPLETTLNLSQHAYFLSLRDQAFMSNGILLETGLAWSTFLNDSVPLGSQAYVIRPESTSGNYFATSHVRAGRLQGIANIVLPPLEWLGHHEFKLGADLDRVTDEQSFERRPILIFREDKTLSRKIEFSGGPSFTRNNFEASGYAQDRWSVSDRLLVEPGIRFDGDAVVNGVAVSPRIASTFMPRRNGETKIVAGVGVYHDPTILDLITRPETGQRVDLFYDATGQTLIRPPVVTLFQVNEGALRLPRSVNWSIGVEHKLPALVYLKLQYMQKRGNYGWTFLNVGSTPSTPFSGLFELRDQRQDHYDGVEATLRKPFKDGHVLFASYVRSSARSNAVLSFSIDNPLFSQQLGGPLPWNAPNRLVSWGTLPLPRKFDLAYSLDWHDGFPFFLVNQDQQVVAPPGAKRFPTFFTLNLTIERRFTVLGYQWALRAGFDNITNRHNPGGVDNNIDSANFLTYGGLSGRAGVARLRLLGRK